MTNNIVLQLNYIHKVKHEDQLHQQEESRTKGEILRRLDTSLQVLLLLNLLNLSLNSLKFRGPQSLETIQRRYNYNNYSLHQSSKRNINIKLIPIWEEESFLHIFNFYPSSNNPDT